MLVLSTITWRWHACHLIFSTPLHRTHSFNTLLSLYLSFLNHMINILHLSHHPFYFYLSQGVKMILANETIYKIIQKQFIWFCVVFIYVDLDLSLIFLKYQNKICSFELSNLSRSCDIIESNVLYHSLLRGMNWFNPHMQPFKLFTRCGVQ